MRIKKHPATTGICTLFAALVCFSSCLTSRKMDKFVANEYNNEIPVPNRKKKTQIPVTSAYANNNSSISTTTHKVSKVLPLVVYWQYDDRHTCALNPSIAVSHFSNAVNTSSVNKDLLQKLNGGQLELTVQQIPAAFALVDKGHMVWLLYAYSWDKVFIQPDTKDLVVAYKLTQTDNSVKTGTITVKNTDQSKGLRFFQSWKSATSEYIGDYNANITAMAKIFMSKLQQEL